MKWYDVIDLNSDILKIFGSYDILNQIPLEDQPMFYQWCKISANYMYMKEALAKEADTQLEINFKP